MRPRVGSVALDRDVEDGVGLEPQRLDERRARLARRLVAQDQQAGAVVGEPQLLARAQHPVGHDATHRAGLDLEAAGQDRPHRRQRDPVPHREVVRPAHDLERLRPGVHQHPPDAVRALDRADLEHPADHDVTQPFADVLDPLDDQPQIVERGPQFPDIVGERGEVTEPAERGAHGVGGIFLLVGYVVVGGGSELREESDVVLQEGTHVGDGVTHLGQPVDAEAEGEARPHVGVDPDRGEDGGVDHAAPAQLDPARVRAGAAALAEAEGAGDLELGRRLGEREVRRPQARLHALAEVGLGEGLDRAGEVAEGDVAIDHQPLDLVEHRQVPCVGGVEAEALPRHHGVNGQRVVPDGPFHQVDLDRGRVGAQQHRLGLADVEVHRVVHPPSRVRRGDVQCLEVVPVRLGLGTLGHGEAHADEDVLELGPGLGHQVQVAPGRRRAHLGRDHLRQIEAVRSQRFGALRLGELGPALGQAGLQAGPDLVQLAARLPARLRARVHPACGAPG